MKRIHYVEFESSEPLGPSAAAIRVGATIDNDIPEALIVALGSYAPRADQRLGWNEDPKEGITLPYADIVKLRDALSSLIDQVPVP